MASNPTALIPTASASSALSDFSMSLQSRSSKSPSSTPGSPFSLLSNTNVNYALASVFGRSNSLPDFRQVALQNMSFDDPALLRGSFSTDALRYWGAVLDQSQATSDWYSLSERADHVDVFISHNWSMPRRDKFLILALDLNMKAAVFSIVLVVVVAAPLSVAGLLPMITFIDGTRMGPWCQVFGSLVFLLTLFCWQEFCRLRIYRGKLLFLDRACIHQADDLLRQRGIDHLAAFLYYSWSFLICYSDEYLQKLWTVYEVSSFMLLHPGSAIHVRHVWFAKFLIGGVVVTFLFDMVWHMLYMPGVLDSSSLPVETVGNLLTVSCFVPASFVIASMVLEITRVRMNMSERVKRFCFAEATCSNERDRSVVQHNIIVFMKHHGHVANEASDADIIHEFETMVQADVPKLLAASLGRVGFPYHFAACISLPYLLQAVDYTCAAIHDGTSVRYTCLDLAYQMNNGFVLVPVSVALSFTIARKLATHRRIGHTSSVCILTTETVLFIGVARALMKSLVMRAIDGGHVELGVFVATLACFCSAALFFYKPRKYQKHQRRLKVI